MTTQSDWTPFDRWYEHVLRQAGVERLTDLAQRDGNACTQADALAILASVDDTKIITNPPRQPDHKHQAEPKSGTTTDGNYYRQPIFIASAMPSPVEWNSWTLLGERAYRRLISQHIQAQESIVSLSPQRDQAMVRSMPLAVYVTWHLPKPLMYKCAPSALTVLRYVIPTFCGLLSLNPGCVIEAHADIVMTEQLNQAKTEIAMMSLEKRS